MSLSSDLMTKSSLLSVLCIPQSSAAKKRYRRPPLFPPY